MCDSQTWLKSEHRLCVEVMKYNLQVKLICVLHGCVKTWMYYSPHVFMLIFLVAGPPGTTLVLQYRGVLPMRKNGRD